MKRNKIKPKYLKIISSENNKTDNTNIFNQIEHIILNSLISLSIIFLFLIWSLLIIIILNILGINYNTLTNQNQIVISLISNLTLSIVLSAFYHKALIKDFKNFFNKNLSENLKISFKYWIIGLSLMLISNLFISIVTSGQLAENEEAIRSLIEISPLLMGLDIIILAPLTEELVFRKSPRNIVQNKYIYSIISGLIFGGLHVITSLESAIDLLYFIPYCSLGITFGLLYSKTNNIFSTITIHAFHNALAFILYISVL